MKLPFRFRLAFEQKQMQTLLGDLFASPKHVLGDFATKMAQAQTFCWEKSKQTTSGVKLGSDVLKVANAYRKSGQLSPSPSPSPSPPAARITDSAKSDPAMVDLDCPTPAGQCLEDEGACVRQAL